MIDNDDHGRDSQANSEQDDEGMRRTHPVAAFSVAQALSMIRQRREAQDRTRQEEERQLEEQRREKAKEKRQRRRKNQKERKAKLKEATAGSSSPMVVSESVELEQQGKEHCSLDEDVSQARGHKRLHDHETDVDGQASQDNDDEINLKRLPVKKRLRLKNRKELTTIPSESDISELKQTITTDVKKVKTLLPRALLLKSNKR